MAQHTRARMADRGCCRPRRLRGSGTVARMESRLPERNASMRLLREVLPGENRTSWPTDFLLFAQAQFVNSPVRVPMPLAGFQQRTLPLSRQACLGHAASPSIPLESPLARRVPDYACTQAIAGSSRNWRSRSVMNWWNLGSWRKTRDRQELTVSAVVSISRSWTVAPAGMLIPICLGLRSPLEQGSLRR